MNSRIGPPRSVNDDAIAAQTLERTLETILNRPPIGLALPAKESTTIIGDGEFESLRRFHDESLLSLHFSGREYEHLLRKHSATAELSPQERTNGRWLVDAIGCQVHAVAK
jgi:hypothetical protein